MSRKTLLTVGVIGFFILLFASSMIMPLIVQIFKPATRANIALSREESQYVSINSGTGATDARYVINYGVQVITGGDLIYFTDRTEAGLTMISVDQENPNTQVEYNSQTGEIKVKATKSKTGDKFIAQLTFDSSAATAFVPSKPALTVIAPKDVSYGYKGRLDVTISPFEVLTTDKPRNINIYAWFTTLTNSVKYVSSKPDAAPKAPNYEAVWKYEKPATGSVGAHTASYDIDLSLDTTKGNILLRTWIEVRYDKLLKVKVDPKMVDTDGGYFPGGGTVYVFQFEQTVKPLG